MSIGGRARLRTVGLALLGGTCLVAIGALGFGFVSSAAPPPSLASANDIKAIPVTPQDYFDEQTATAVLSPEPDREIRLRTAGLITSANCGAGTTLVSGASNFSVDGVAVLNLHTSVPLWRDLSAGDRGDDVLSLKATLRGAGYTTADDNVLRRNDVEAVRALFTKVGADSGFRTLSQSQIIWLPAPEVAVASCEVTIGDKAELDEVLATVGGGAAASLTGLSAGSLAGPRVLLIDDIEVALNDDLTMQPEGVASLVATPSYQSAKLDATDKATMSIPVRLRLITPVVVAPLPPGSVHLTADGEGCVTGEGPGPMPVRVLSSELGRTIVQFESTELPASVSLTAPTSCD